MKQKTKTMVPAPPQEEMRAYLVAREKAKRGEGWCSISPSGKLSWGNERGWRAAGPREVETRKHRPIDTTAQERDLNLKIAAKKLTWQLEDGWDTDPVRYQAVQAIAFAGADPRHIVTAFDAAHKAGIRLVDLPTVRQILRHGLPPARDGSWDAFIDRYRALSAAMEFRLLPWIKQARATPWPETLERIREDVDTVDRFLAAYVADCEAQAQQLERWAEAIDKDTVGDSPLTFPRSQPDRRRRQVERILYVDLCSDLERAGVAHRDRTACSILAALLPEAFGQDISPDAMRQRLARQRKKPLSSKGRRRKKPAVKP